jgi:hypothetical protein
MLACGLNSILTRIIEYAAIHVVYFSHILATAKAPANSSGCRPDGLLCRRSLGGAKVQKSFGLWRCLEREERLLKYWNCKVLLHRADEVPRTPLQRLDEHCDYI